MAPSGEIHGAIYGVISYHRRCAGCPTLQLAAVDCPLSATVSFTGGLVNTDPLEVGPLGAESRPFD